ncbi:MAG: class I tRNA ligase family protein [Lachnospiraceae bacterium]|nr:class I tRNA ligase family protein [Lachnospiraceae bacterium]
MYSKRIMKDERPTFPKRAVVTAGMPYGNKKLHFGHVGGMFVHADIFARFLRDRIGKDNVIFVSGTDCYGSPILESYRKQKEAGYTGSIEDYVTENHKSQKKTLDAYGISLNLFGASALGETGAVHHEVSAEIFRTLYRNGHIKKLSVPQFYDEERKVFLNGRQVIGKCPIPGCTSDKAYADECSLGHQFLPSELLHPMSSLSGKKPVLKEVENWYLDLEESIDSIKEYNDFLRKNTNTRKYQLETVEEFLKQPAIYVPRKYVENLAELSARLPKHRLVDEEKKNSVLFEFETLEERDKAKAVLEQAGIHYTSGKTLVPFRLSGNVAWGVPFPACEELQDLTFWVWPESLWAPISFTKTYLKQQGKEAELAKWWNDDEALVYQFIGEDNIYFYSIAQTGIFAGLRAAKGTEPDIKGIHMSHIIANRHLLYMDTKASSSSEIKPPMAEDLLEFYTKDQLRMHFMSLGLSSKSVGFKPQVFMKVEERAGVDMVLKEGNLITNVLNRLIRSCFYAVQNNHGGRIPEGEVSERIKEMAEAAVLEYERHMYNHEFHRISYVLDDFIRAINKHWVNNVKLADSKGDTALRTQILVDCFYACKVMSILVHPIAPEGCEMFREYLRLGEELWDWKHILEPISFYTGDLSRHELKVLEPRVDFFRKHECQINEEQ